MGEKYDFSGYATKNDLTCSDGRIIRQDAFKDCDGLTVPLVWMHNHNDPDNVLGHCLLENRPDGVYTYGFFNDTDKGRNAKEQVRHKDIDSLSIWANHLKQSGNSDGSVNVVHGDIKEVSLVLSGANPGAMIDTVILEHSGEESEDDLIIYSGAKLTEEGELMHTDTNTDSEKDEEPDSKETNNKESKMGDDNKENKKDERTVQDVFEEFTDEQKNVVYYLIGEALKDAGIEPEEEAAQSDEDGEEDMKHNVFDNSMDEEKNTLSHEDMEAIFKDGKRLGSLKEAVLAHDDESEVTYGIENMDYLFPDDKTVGNMPNMISRDMGWVSTVIDGVHHTPFSRIKMINADITADQARALGYFKGNLKKEEVFTLLKRRIDPQTIYKKQKLDRDDVLDITDFDVVAWLKGEMQVMLEEEKARAILVGDGRSDVSDDKIGEDHIRPVWTDADTYTIKSEVSFTGLATNGAKADAIIDAAIRARKDYKGSGNPTFFAPESTITEMLLIKDTTGRKIYNGISDLATALRVKEIVSVPVMENLSRTSGTGNDAKTLNLLGVIFNPDDYTVGGNKPGQKKLFEDFDIDYNQMKYLIEDRISGALTLAHSLLAETNP